MKSSIGDRAKRRSRKLLLRILRTSGIDYVFYPSWWRMTFSRKPNIGEQVAFISATPNPGAGIGHQLANWIAGFWFAEYFKVPFAHTQFTPKQWDEFLGLGENEPLVGNLVDRAGYKIIRLPLFDESSASALERTRRIIEHHRTRRVVLMFEQDQFYRDQYPVRKHLQTKFDNCAKREGDRLIFDPAHYNVAVHIRRGDIATPEALRSTELSARFQDVSYFACILKSLLAELVFDRQIHLHIFSQGGVAEFACLSQFNLVHLHLEMGPQQSFLHMVRADLLITSKSSFSYKPALLSRGIKIVPRNFWHGYPDDQTWVKSEDDGSLALEELTKLRTALAVIDTKNNSNLSKPLDRIHGV